MILKGYFGSDDWFYSVVGFGNGMVVCNVVFDVDGFELDNLGDVIVEFLVFLGVGVLLNNCMGFFLISYDV